MSTIVEEAFTALSNLSPPRRDELAGYLRALAVEDSEPEPIDPTHLPAILEGLEQIRKRQFASDERIAAIFSSFEG